MKYFKLHLIYEKCCTVNMYYNYHSQTPKKQTIQTSKMWKNGSWLCVAPAYPFCSLILPVCELVRMWMCCFATRLLGEWTAKRSFSFHFWRRPFLKAQQQNEPLNGPFISKGQREDGRWICKKKKRNRPIFSTIKDVWMESTLFTIVRRFLNSCLPGVIFALFNHRN